MLGQIITDRRTKKRIQRKADSYVLEGTPASYLKALTLFKRLRESYPKEDYYQALVNICGVYDENYRKKAINNLEKLVKQAQAEGNRSATRTFKKYLAQGYIYENKNDEALKLYSEVLKDPDLSSEELLLYTLKKKQVENAKIIDSENKKLKGKVIPFLSTSADEYNATFNFDLTIMMFTYLGEKSKGGLMDESFKSDPINGEYYEDVFVSYNHEGKWSRPEGFSDNVNTLGHDASVSLNMDGHSALIYRSNLENNGDIYISKFQGGEWSKPRGIKGDVNTNYWEGSAFIQNGSKYIYFSSGKPGGYGGRDLYIAKLDEKGAYTSVKNLGPNINTSGNEDAPFLYPDNKTLFFSSDGLKTLGGYDIFMSEKDDNLEWTKPVNIGRPINSPNDDRYFFLSYDAKRGFFSSARNEKGYDIYEIDLSKDKLFKGKGVVVIKGVVLADDIPIDANITVSNVSGADRGSVFGNYMSNSKTGSFLIALNKSEKYNIHFDQVGYTPVDIEIDLSKAKRVGILEQNVFMYSEIYEGEKVTSDDIEFQYKMLVKKLFDIDDDFEEDDSFLIEEDVKEPKKEKKLSNRNRLIFDDNFASITSKFITPTDSKLYIKDFKQIKVGFLKGKDLNNKAYYLALLKNARFFYNSNLIYKVQVAAYENAQNYKARKVKKFGNPEFNKLSDGVTRFTQGKFRVLADAEKFRKIVQKSGIFDAWITVSYSGNRFFLEDLIDVEFDLKKLKEMNKRD